MNKKIVVWNNDKSGFIAQRLLGRGEWMTTDINKAKQFNSLEAAQEYIEENEPPFSVSYLEIVAQY
jgi:hypothetical protein